MRSLSLPYYLAPLQKTLTAKPPSHQTPLTRISRLRTELTGSHLSRYLLPCSNSSTLHRWPRGSSETRFRVTPVRLLRRILSRRRRNPPCYNLPLCLQPLPTENCNKSAQPRMFAPVQRNYGTSVQLIALRYGCSFPATVSIHFSRLPLKTNLSAPYIKRRLNSLTT